MFNVIRPLLFSMDAEDAHHLALDNLKRIERTPLRCLMAQTLPADPVTLWNIAFPNRVGLAAGLDKNGDYLDAMAMLGFGFIEIGTVTPRPQGGNPRPRIFRLKEVSGIINRMGFNNHGVDYLVERVKAARYRGVLGINIGKNFDTPVENANDDYIACLRKAYVHASYITVNISSPNTKGLRDLQFGAALESLLQVVKAERDTLAQQHQKQVPLLLKIAPDLEERDVIEIADQLKRQHWDGAIATNTTLARAGVEGLRHANEQGGLSGKPVLEKSTQVLRWFSREVNGAFPIIGVGGITRGDDAKTKMAAGASLVQIYSGFIYRGPDLVRECGVALAQK